MKLSGILTALVVALVLMVATDGHAAEKADLSRLQATVLQDVPTEGKVVYVDFWASWCAPCKKSFPWMERIHREYAESGLVVVAINLDEDQEKAQRFLARAHPTFLVTSDHARELAEAFDLKAMPTSFLFGRDGKLILRHEGFENQASGELESELVAALENPGGHRTEAPARK